MTHGSNERLRTIVERIERLEEEMILDTYLGALGMLPLFDGGQNDG